MCLQVLGLVEVEHLVFDEISKVLTLGHVHAEVGGDDGATHVVEELFVLVRSHVVKHVQAQLLQTQLFLVNAPLQQYANKKQQTVNPVKIIY